MKRIYGLIAIVVILNGCRVVYPDRLFQIERERLVMADTVKTANEYVIRRGDLLSVGVFSNNGYELVDVINRDATGFSPLEYTVKQSGYVVLPMLDSVSVSGLTISEAEQILVKKYSYYFVNPYLRIEVRNRNVYIFKGRQGATVVTLDRENMNLLEVLGKSGGIPAGGKAYDIRILRGEITNPTVFDIDLSTVDGMSRANLTMQANDIVYIETRFTANDLLVQVTPIFSLITSVFVIAYSVVAVTKL